MVQNYEEPTKPRLFIEGGEDLGEQAETWKYVLDFSKIYDESNLLDFNQNLEQVILVKKNDLITIVGVEFYNKLVELVNNTKNTESFHTVYDSIYDLCDEYDIKIQI